MKIRACDKELWNFFQVTLAPNSKMFHHCCSWLTFKDSVTGLMQYSSSTKLELRLEILAQQPTSSITKWFKLTVKNCVCLLQWSLTCSFSEIELGLTAVKSITLVTGAGDVHCHPWQKSYCLQKLQDFTLSASKLMMNLVKFQPKMYTGNCRTLPSTINAFFRLRIFQLCIILRSKTLLSSAI